LGALALVGSQLAFAGAATSEHSAQFSQPLGRSISAGSPHGQGIGPLAIEELPPPAAVVDSLRRAKIGEEVLLPDWPVSPGAYADSLVRRFDVYSPEARIYEVRAGRQRELPRSRLLFFLGSTQDWPPARILIQVDPDTRDLRAMSLTEGGVYEFAPSSASEGAYQMAAKDRGEDGNRAPWTCGQEYSTAVLVGDTQVAFVAPEPDLFAEAISSLHTATIAVDTDNEIMNGKFGASTTTATNYIASLFAAMNLIYERDLLVRLLQGLTYLRVGTGDPYGSPPDTPTCSGTCPELYEFRNYWAGGCGGTGQPSCSGVPRALATLLSGRGAGGGASGIAFINSLCSTASGYSYTVLSASGTSPWSGEIMVEAHEIGHNFGSPHTHCYSPPIDQCWNAEFGCYSGSSRSCPAPATYSGVPNVTGTLMSYCHTLGGCSTANVFHPTTVALLNPLIEARAGPPTNSSKCIYPAVDSSGSISGTLTDAGSSAAISGAWVGVFNSSAVQVGNASTNASGVYTVGGLPTGTYYARASASTYFDELYDDLPCQAGCTVTSGTGILVTTGSNTPDIDFALSQPGSISGTLSDAASGLPIASALVRVHDSGGIQVGSATTNGSGVYAVGGLLAGTYFAVTSSGRHLNELYDDLPCDAGCTVTSGTPISVAPGSNTPNINFALAPRVLDLFLVSPCRLLDTRNATGPYGGPSLAAGGTRFAQVSGQCGVPADARSVSVNLTAVSPSASGWLTLFPGDMPLPASSTMNYRTNRTRANNAIIPLSSAGGLNVYNSGPNAVHFIIDVNGYFE
jgi:hypothetical protein